MKLLWQLYAVPVPESTDVNSVTVNTLSKASSTRETHSLDRGQKEFRPMEAQSEYTFTKTCCRAKLATNPIDRVTALTNNAIDSSFKAHRTIQETAAE